MTSVLNVDTIADKAGTGPVGLTKQHAAKAWIGWVYSSGDIVISDSFNISGSTDTGTGDAQFSLTNTMESAAGASAVVGSNHSTTGNILADKDSASAFANRLFNSSGGAEDSGGNFSMTIHGDLA
tara:strand:- start:435 stop:809 length:375 start_codon:yes stop_codon:yes gene_type:complete